MSGWYATLLLQWPVSPAVLRGFEDVEPVTRTVLDALDRAAH